MTDLEKTKAKPRAKKKPPTQTAGVGGIDAHGSMGEGQPEQRIDWGKLTTLPAFEMFVFEQSGQAVGSSAGEWVRARREAIGDDKLYDLYAEWHDNKGLWLSETPLGKLKESDT